jgi:hypothetical protein
VVPFDRVIPPLGIEVHVAELHRGVYVLRIVRENRVQCLNAALVQHGRLLLNRAARSRLRRNGRGRGTGSPGLLRPDHPAEDDAKTNTGNDIRDRFRFHNCKGVGSHLLTTPNDADPNYLPAST